MIQRHIRTFLDAQPPAATPRAVSACAGDGRDLLEVLAAHPLGSNVRARLVELDGELVTRARTNAERCDLEEIQVACADAGLTDAYAGAVPAELVLACGVFGNISDADVRTTIDCLPQLCARGATLIWTRHRHDPGSDLTPRIREWLADRGFTEQAFESPAADSWSVGLHRFTGEPEPLERGKRLFTFVR